MKSVRIRVLRFLTILRTRLLEFPQGLPCCGFRAVSREISVHVPDVEGLLGKGIASESERNTDTRKRVSKKRGTILGVLGSELVPTCLDGMAETVINIWHQGIRYEIPFNCIVETLAIDCQNCAVSLRLRDLAPFTSASANLYACRNWDLRLEAVSH